MEDLLILWAPWEGPRLGEGPRLEAGPVQSNCLNCLSTLEAGEMGPEREHLVLSQPVAEQQSKCQRGP